LGPGTTTKAAMILVTSALFAVIPPGRCSVDRGLAQDETAPFAVWTDRRNRISIFESDNDVFGSRVIAGGGTP
jgi:hypothetical protein